MENKHSCNHIYVIIGLQTIKHTNNQTYKVTCYLVSKLTKKKNVKKLSKTKKPATKHTRLHTKKQILKRIFR